MTSIMNQVTCSLCGIKVDEKKRGEHLVSIEQLKVCKEQKSIILDNFFELISDTYQNRKDIYNLKNEKALNFWESYFATKLPKEKFDVLRSNPNKKAELEDSLTTDLLDFTNQNQYESDKPPFDSLDKITICRNCITDVHNSLLYEHINSKKHRDIENYFIKKCMTYCDRCYVEIKNDE